MEDVLIRFSGERVGVDRYYILCAKHQTLRISRAWARDKESDEQYMAEQAATAKELKDLEFLKENIHHVAAPESTGAQDADAANIGKTYSLYCDAAYNPQLSCTGIGCVLYAEDNVRVAFRSDFAMHSNKIFVSDINTAEGYAIASGLEICQKIAFPGDTILIYTDNITSYRLLALNETPYGAAVKTVKRVKYSETLLRGVNIKYIKEVRENNHAADALAFAAINACIREY